MHRGAVLGIVVLLLMSGCVGEVPAPESDDKPPTEPATGTLEIHTINVGQADATLIIAPSGETMLIDSGDWPQDGEHVLAYLNRHEIDRIDHLVTTHVHADHIGGHATIIEHYETKADGIGAIWDPGVVHTSNTYERYLDAVEQYNVTLYETQAGDEIDIEGLNVRVLNPPAEREDPDAIIGSDLTLRIQHGNITYLTAGDAERETEAEMLDRNKALVAADIYQVNHHGSNTSSSSAFLAAVDPEVAVISSAYESQYGHPHEEVLQRLEDRNIQTYWTAVHGTTVFESDGETIDVLTQAEATTDPTALREYPAVSVDPTEPPAYRGQVQPADRMEPVTP